MIPFLLGLLLGAISTYYVAVMRPRVREAGRVERVDDQDARLRRWGQRRIVLRRVV